MSMAFPFRRADFIQILRISTSFFCAPRTSLSADSLFTISKTGLERTQTSLWETEPSKIFIYISKYEEFKNPVVKAYMKYFATRNANSRETKTINDQVSFYKADTLIRNKYMTFEYELHEREEKVKLEMVDAMLAKTKLTDEEISIVSGIPQDEIAKRRAQ